MSKKDYELIAAALLASRRAVERNCVGDDLLPALGAWQVTVNELADALDRANPRFRRHTFLAACGVKE